MRGNRRGGRGDPDRDRGRGGRVLTLLPGRASRGQGDGAYPSRERRPRETSHVEHGQVLYYERPTAADTTRSLAPRSTSSAGVSAWKPSLRAEPGSGWHSTDDGVGPRRDGGERHRQDRGLHANAVRWVDGDGQASPRAQQRDGGEVEQVAGRRCRTCARRARTARCLRSRRPQCTPPRAATPRASRSSLA